VTTYDILVYGGTPDGIAASILSGSRTRLVTGVSIPHLLKVRSGSYVPVMGSR
jgi:mannose/fructose-specific phosphotransferase system component IIA